MRVSIPPFGFISALATGTVFIPHALVFLLVFLFIGEQSAPFFLYFTIVSRLASDGLFWIKWFPSEVDELVKNAAPWRTAVKSVLLSQPAAIKAINDMVIDAAVDVFLIVMAFKASVSPMWILIIFSGGQGVGAILQALAIYYFDKKNIRIISMVVTVIVTCAVLEISGIFPSQFYTKFLGLATLAKPTAMLIIMGAKYLLTGTTVIAKETIAEVIVVKNLLKKET